MLKIENLNVRYGGIHAIRGISMEVPMGKIVTLIGANGAGKSSTLRSVAGLVKSKTGSISWKGKNLLGLLPEEILMSGVALCPEGRRIFPQLTVLENLKLGGYSRKDKAGLESSIERAFKLFPRLKERAWQKGGTLSGGEQQMLAIARAMMSKPRILLLDEPSLGLAPIVIREIFKELKVINKELGMTILIVEQNARQALLLSNRAYVLQTGKMIKEGASADLLHDPEIEAAYLGGKKG